MSSRDRRTLLTWVETPAFVDELRALSDTLHVEGDLQRDNNFRIDFRNRGDAEAVFHVRSGDYTDLPRSYTVEAGQHLAGLWSAPIDYDLSVFGSNDFFRHFQGDTIGPHRADLIVRAYYHDDRITLAIANEGPDSVRVRVKSAYSSQQQAFALSRGDAATRWWALGPTAGWYDLTVTIDDNLKFRSQLAGRVSARRRALLAGLGGRTMLPQDVAPGSFVPLEMRPGEFVVRQSTLVIAVSPLVPCSQHGDVV